MCKCILNKTDKIEINKNWPQWDLRGRHSAVDMQIVQIHAKGATTRRIKWSKKTPKNKNK